MDSEEKVNETGAVSNFRPMIDKQMLEMRVEYVERNKRERMS